MIDILAENTQRLYAIRNSEKKIIAFPQQLPHNIVSLCPFMLSVSDYVKLQVIKFNEL